MVGTVLVFLLVEENLSNCCVYRLLSTMAPTARNNQCRPTTAFLLSRHESAVREAAVIADNLHHGSPNEDIGTVQELAGGRGKRAAPIAGGKNLPGTSSSTAEASYAADSSSVPSRAPPADVVNAGAASGDGAGRSGAGASGGGAGADRQVVLFPIIPSLRSARNPSSTLAWLLIVQVQFLAVLSLVDSAGSGHSWLADFLRHLRWGWTLLTSWP